MVVVLLIALIVMLTTVALVNRSGESLDAKLTDGFGLYLHIPSDEFLLGKTNVFQTMFGHKAIISRDIPRDEIIVLPLNKAVIMSPETHWNITRTYYHAPAEPGTPTDIDADIAAQAFNNVFDDLYNNIYDFGD